MGSDRTWPPPGSLVEKRHGEYQTNKIPTFPAVHGRGRNAKLEKIKFSDFRSRPKLLATTHGVQALPPPPRNDKFPTTYNNTLRKSIINCRADNIYFQYVLVGRCIRIYTYDIIFGTTATTIIKITLLYFSA